MKNKLKFMKLKINLVLYHEKRNISITYKYSVIPSKTFTFDETRHPNPFRRKKKD